MTREEAISLIKSAQLMLINPTTNEPVSDLYESLEMAIQALSQEPTFDDECQKDMDEAWEQIQKKRKRIPVTLDLTPCDDAISRADFESHLFENYCIPVSKIGKPNQYSSGCFYKDVVKCLDDLPSVTQKSGKWHIAHGWYEDRFWCSCGYIRIMDSRMNEWKYCPVCGGAKMVEPQESEDKE